MKVLQINNFHYLRGGSDRVYLETGNILEQKGHEVAFFSSLHENNIPTPYSKYFVSEQKLKGISGLKNINKFLYNSEACKNLASLIQDFKPDIAHLHIFQSRLSSGIIKVLKDHNIPMVMTVHEYKIICPVYVCLDQQHSICEKCAKGNYWHSISKKCTRNSYAASMLNAMESYLRDKKYSYTHNINSFVYPSRFIKDKHISYKKELEGKSHVVHNFVNPLPPEWKVPPKQNYFLYFGRLSHEKGILSLMKVWEQFPDTVLKIVGQGEMLEEIKVIIQKKGLANIELLGAKYGDELKNIIAAARFSIVPSEWHETFGLTIIESYQCGTPVIAASIGGITEIVIHNKTGYLFESRNKLELKNAIKRAIELNTNEFLKMSDYVVDYAEQNFNIAQYYEELLSIYQQVNCK